MAVAECIWRDRWSIRGRQQLHVRIIEDEYEKTALWKNAVFFISVPGGTYF